ncbi:complement C1q tumor necrosis factor-related protein 6-like [Ruditapes philippinarum]|uniref:complement C1q tumor necrosis factor-related protein 6-like n=1 Tax=Ruditapes philippinarum TaxID=129788 RepID=UPI00295BDA17|nr:complement C1q tumor necrosis factor-related protein 6-like [Ruditapes philippinarum]
MFRSLGIFFCSLALLSAEQSCSKFHYEEQTLRKMITVEILVDKLKADVDETKGNLHDTLAYITTERTESTKMLKQITSRIVDIENILKDLKPEKDKAEIIHFSARGIKNKSPAIKETLVFSSIMSNNGSAYDKTTGIFTAPVGGLYMFNLQLCITSDKYLYFEIVANDQAIFRGLGLDDTSRWSTCHSYSTSTLLKALDKVSVKAARTNGGALWESDPDTGICSTDFSF